MNSFLIILLIIGTTLTSGCNFKTDPIKKSVIDKSQNQPTQLKIYIKTDSYLINGKSHSFTSLKNMLSSDHYNSKQVVIIESSQTTSYQNVVKVIELLNKNGFHNIKMETN